MLISLRMILIFFLILSSNLLAVETRGILRPLQKQKSYVVGEVYSFKFTLIPFEKNLIRKEDLLDKKFLDYFYVTEVWRIEQSENNTSAVVITLDLVLAKNFSGKGSVLWAWGERNIPITLDINSIQDTKLSINKFILFSSPLSERFQLSWWHGFLLFLLGVVLLSFLIRVRRKKREEKGEAFLSWDIIGKAKSHADFEMIYRVRKKLEEKYPETSPGREDYIRDFRNLIKEIETHQFSRQWKSFDLDQLIRLKKKVMEHYKSGI